MFIKSIGSKQFKKDIKKIPLEIYLKFEERLLLFSQNPYHPLINYHALKGEYAGNYSINITGDYRLIFSFLDENILQLHRIGTHSQLYKK